MVRSLADLEPFNQGLQRAARGGDRERRGRLRADPQLHARRLLPDQRGGAQEYTFSRPLKIVWNTELHVLKYIFKGIFSLKRLLNCCPLPSDACWGPWLHRAPGWPTSLRCGPLSPSCWLLLHGVAVEHRRNCKDGSPQEPVKHLEQSVLDFRDEKRVLPVREYAA